MGTNWALKNLRNKVLVATILFLVMWSTSLVRSEGFSPLECAKAHTTNRRGGNKSIRRLGTTANTRSRMAYSSCLLSKSKCEKACRQHEHQRRNLGYNDMDAG